MAISEPIPLTHLLQRYRLAAGLTQEELAERAGVSVRGVSDLERGIITRPRAYTVYQLAEALQLSPHDRALFEAAAHQWTVLPGDRPRGEHARPTGTFLGALPLGPLAARDEEMQRIRQVLEAVSGGAGQVLLLAGESGVGKTRLAQELMVEAERCRFLVLTGRCQSTHDAEPLAPIWQALSALEQHDSWITNPELMRRWQQVMAVAQSSVEPHLFQTLGELITRQSEIGPLALLLDDVQRATPTTAQFVQHLARLISTAPVLLAVAYREAQLTEQNPVLAQAVQDLARERLVERITLRRFLPDETAAFATALMSNEPLSEDFAGFLQRRSKGNPRYIEELVRSLGGRLELEAEIGAGATGRVFAAYDRKTDREVAAKLMLARGEMSVETLHRFQQEGALLAALSHPNIVQIYGTFIEEHASCIVMERVTGQSLRQVLEGGPLPLPRAKHLAVQVAAALEHAHQAQIIHCDVKPDNIMVTPEDKVKVTDFGIARILRPEVTLETIATTGMRMGTPLYMAPEQIQGKHVDGRTDVYGLGAVLFHMLTGRPPFEGDDPLAIIAQHLQEHPPPPSAVEPSVPAEWDAPVLKALAKDPVKRFQSAAAFSRAIADLSTDPRPSSAIGMARSKGRRRSALMALVGGIAVVTIIAVVAVQALHGTVSPPTRTSIGRSVPQWGYAGFISPSLLAPSGIAVNGQGDIYVADTNHDRILELSPNGLPIAQVGTPGNGIGQLSRPGGLLVDNKGDVYVADTGNWRIQEFSPKGKWIGQSSIGSGVLRDPVSLAADGAGNIYVTTVPDPYFGSNLVKLDARGHQETELWLGSHAACIGNCPTSALGDPVAVAVDANGNVYLPDSNGIAIRKLSPTGTLVATLLTALNHPSGIAIDHQGNILVADTGNSRLLKLSAKGRLLASWRSAGPGSLPFRQPRAVSINSHGTVYVADTGNNRVVKLAATGIASVLSGSSSSVPVVARSQFSLRAMAIDAQDNLWTVDQQQGRVYEISSGGSLKLEWALPTSLGVFAEEGLAVDRGGRVYLVALLTDVSRYVIVEFSSSGAFQREWGSTGTGPGALNGATGVAVNRQGEIYVADTANYRIQRFSPSGQALGPWGSFGSGPGRFAWPVGVATDRHGNVWIVDSANSSIEKFSPGGTLLSRWGQKGTKPGEFLGPMGIAMDAQDNVYVADTGNNRIQVLSPTGDPLAVAGRAGIHPGGFRAPYQVSIDSRGDIYVLDWYGIHKFAPSR